MQSKRSRRRKAVSVRILQLEKSLSELADRVRVLEMLVIANDHPSPSATDANRLVDQIALGLSLSRKVESGEHSLVPKLQADPISDDEPVETTVVNYSPQRRHGTRIGVQPNRKIY